MSAAPARVVESFGRRAIVQTSSNTRMSAAIFGKRTEIVCGDWVRLEQASASEEPQIVEVLPRKRALVRTDSRGRTETLAANLDLLAVVLACEPQPDLYVADRYLAGAALAGLETVVILNKSDLESSGDWLREYRDAGYATLSLSARAADSMSILRACIGNQTFMLAGQSGVGKSTLTNALVPESARATRELSDASGEGRHTTVSSAMFALPGGGALIDSPGVRDYAPPPCADDKVQVGWPEILRLAPQCRFNDCLHLREPGCAVLAAIELQTIAPRRYESYKRLLNLMRQLKPSHERF